MKKQTNIFILTIWSVILAQTIFADYPNSSNKMNVDYQQNQTPPNQSVNQFTPETSEEGSFILESQNRLDQIKQENRNMIEQDRNMMREGYDPNENYYNSKVKPSKEQYDPNNSFKNQEQIMRGNSQGYQTDSITH